MWRKRILVVFIQQQTLWARIDSLRTLSAGKEKKFSDFSRVEIGSAFQATISQGDAYQVSITLDDNAWDYLEVSQ